MNSTQRSSRYSSAGNSGYDDDFELDGDDLDGDVEVDTGQADDDDAAGNNDSDAADAAGTASTDAAGYDGHNGGDHEGNAAAFTESAVPGASAEAGFDPARKLFLGQDDPASRATSRQSSRRASLADPTQTRPPTTPAVPTHPRDSISPSDAPLVDSPTSPPPPLPPLNQTVSPYLARGPGTQPATPSGPTAPLPPRLPPAYPQPVGSLAATSTPPRPTTSRGSSQAGAGPAGASAGPRPPTPETGAVPQASHHTYELAEPPQQQYQYTAERSSSGGGAGGTMPALALALLQHASSQGATEQQQQQQHQLAAAISHSVEVLRASEHVRQLQAAVEVLTGQLVASERGRSGAEAALVELTQRMQENEKRLNESWEAKLLEKQREVQQLRTKVQQLEAQGIKGRLTAASTPTARSSHQGPAGGGGGPSISPEEAATLRKELEQTELLIRGYQQENEMASRRIKELEESLAAAESRAAAEALRTERATLLARDDVGRRNAETAAKLARVLALEKELAGVREEAQTRETELKAQVDKLRAEKKALEARAGGVDLKAMAEGDVLVKQLREEMETSRQATQGLIQEMQAKLAWYAENQELLNKNDALVAEQRETIQQLQARLVQYEGQASSKGPAANRLAAAQARIQALEAEADQLRKALCSRAPASSLAAAMAAARPTAEESQLVAELREQVEALEERLRMKDEEFELSLRTYQQQFERLKAQYSERASRLEAVTKVRSRAKDLERQLEDQKGIFLRRIRDLEAKLKAAQEQGATIPPTPAPLAQPYPTAGAAAAGGGAPSTFQTPTKGPQAGSGGGGPHPHPGPGHGAPNSAHGAGRRDDLVPASYLRAKELEVKKLHTELERRAKQVSELHLRLGEAESRTARLTADLRRSNAHNGGAGTVQSPLSGRTRHDGLSHDDRPVGPSRGSARQRLDPYPSSDGADTGGSGGPGGRGLAAAGGRQVSPDLLERLEERCGTLTVENGNLRGQVQALTQQLAALRRELDAAREAVAAQPAASDQASAAAAASAATISDLRRKLEAAELALVTVQRSATEAVERGALAAAEHQRAMLRLHDEVAYKEGLKWQERLSTLEQELRTAQQRCEQLEAELAVARSRGAGSWSPEASAFAAMERRLDDMARDMAAREAKWRAVLQDTQSLHNVESDLQKRKWESTLAAKEAEVQATRAELQSLLQEVAQVQELQSRVVAKQRQQQQQHKLAAMAPSNG